MVIDRDTGTIPPSAAERMAEYDRRMGNETIRTASHPVPDGARGDQATPAIDEGKKPGPPPPSHKAAARNARPQPWKEPHAKPVAPAARASMGPRPNPAPQVGGRKTIVTGKWWDAKGPRTIELGPKGQQTLSGGFVTLFFAVLIVAIVTLFIAPIVLFIGAFLAFRFGGRILGPIGAGIVDKAVAERN